MRIAFVIPYFYPALGYGGTPRLAYEMARVLAGHGHEITVFTTDSGPVTVSVPATINLHQKPKA